MMREGRTGKQRRPARRRSYFVEIYDDESEEEPTLSGLFGNVETAMRWVERHAVNGIDHWRRYFTDEEILESGGLDVAVGFECDNEHHGRHNYVILRSVPTRRFVKRYPDWIGNYDVRIPGRVS